MNNTLLYQILSYQNVRSILSIEKSKSTNDEQKYFSNLIQLIFLQSSINNETNIKVILKINT